MLADAGLTVTEATGTILTVIAALPLLPSLVAVIVAEPAATAETRPLALTDATAVLLLDQVRTRPVSVLAAESLVTADSCCVPPTPMVADAGLRVTVATGTFVTVMVDVPLWPSLVAVIVADPTALLLTRPLAFTVATAASLVAQVTTRPESGAPDASCGTAVSWVDVPTLIVADEGLTVTEATGTGLTVTVAEAVWLSLVATIVVVPAETPVARPLELTVAAPGLLLTHVIRRPVSGLPAESSGAAVNCCTAPTRMPAVVGDRVSEATETLLTVTVAESATEPGLARALTLYCPGAAGAW